MMPVVRAVVLIILLVAAPAYAQAPRWTVDVTPASYVEAWELNDSVEHLTGIQAGIDRRVWRSVAVRAEGLLLHVHQAGDDTWLRGASLGMRARRPFGVAQGRRVRVTELFLDVAGGWAGAAKRVPPTGTRYNYLALIGGGVEAPLAGLKLALGIRWLHISNGGREGRFANPDIQSLGASVGLGYAF
jgi:hypothetical protein